MKKFLIIGHSGMDTARRRRLSLALTLVSTAALLACSVDLSLNALGPDQSLPEVQGRYVSPASGLTATWSASGEDVTFVSTDLRSAYAYHGQSGAIRELYVSNTPGEQIFHVVLSADGMEWFTHSGGPAGARIQRHTSAGSTVLTDRPGRGLPDTPADGRGVVVASVQPVAAFIVGPDSLFLLRRGGEPTLLGSGCEGIVAFSLDELQVLCSAGGSVRVFRTDGSGTVPLVLPDEVLWTAQLIRWGAQGIQVLYSGGERYLLYVQSSGSSHPFTPPAKYPESTWFGKVSWSGDGRKAAYWNRYCAQSEGLFGCRITQVFLYVLDVATGTATRVAVHTLPSGGSEAQVAVSPTGSLVAYTINDGLYLVELK